MIEKIFAEEVNITTRKMLHITMQASVEQAPVLRVLPDVSIRLAFKNHVHPVLCSVVTTRHVTRPLSARKLVLRESLTSIVDCKVGTPWSGPYQRGMLQFWDGGAHNVW